MTYFCNFMVHWLILIFKIIVFYLLLLNRQNKKGQRTSVAARQIHKRYKDCFTVDKLGFIKKKIWCTDDCFHNTFRKIVKVRDTLYSNNFERVWASICLTQSRFCHYTCKMINYYAKSEIERATYWNMVQR